MGYLNAIVPNDNTADWVGLVFLLTKVCNAVITYDIATIGSIQDSGSAACPPLPVTVISTSLVLALRQFPENSSSLSKMNVMILIRSANEPISMTDASFVKLGIGILVFQLATSFAISLTNMTSQPYGDSVIAAMEIV